MAELLDNLQTQEQGTENLETQEDLQVREYEENSQAVETEETQETEENQTTQQAIKTWLDSLSDELRNQPSLKKFKSVNDLAKSYLELQKAIGKKGIILPGKNATKEEWDAFFKALGRPDKPEDYKLPEVKLPDGLAMEETLVEEFRNKAHEIGLNQKQVEELFKWYSDLQSGFYTHFQELKDQERKQAETELRKKWGFAYNEKLNRAKLMIQDADEYEYSFFEEHGNDPRLIHFLARKAGFLSEDKLKGSPKGFTKTPEEARREILRIKADPNHPFNKEDHPEHEAALQYVEDLYKQAYPELAR